MIFGETGLFFANLGATVISMVYAFAMTWIVLKVIGWIKRLKPETDELEAGLDLTFHGERALDHD